MKRALLLLALLCSCRSETRAPERPAPAAFPVSSLSVEDVTPAEDRPSCALKDLRALLQQAVDAEPLLRRAPDSRGGYSIRAEVYQALLSGERPVTEAWEGTVHAAVRMEARKRRPGDIAEAHDIEVRRQAALPGARPGTAAEVMESEMRAALREAISVIARRISVRNGGDDSVIKALADADPRIAAAGAEEAGSRRLAAAPPGLLALLKSPEPDAVLAAIGALGALKAESAIRPLVDLARHNNRQVRLAAVYALGDIGTSEARRSLGIISEAHPDDQIRATVREILEALEAKE
jgi:hypothetical protein